MRVSHRCTYVCWKYRVKSRFLHVEAGPKEASCRQASAILAVTVVTVFRKADYSARRSGSHNKHRGHLTTIYSHHCSGVKVGLDQAAPWLAVNYRCIMDIRSGPH